VAVLSVPTFRKLPVEVDAVQWFTNGDHPQDGPPDTEGRVVRYWRRPDVAGDTPCPVCGAVLDRHGWIDTFEGGHRVCPGDWIVTGVRGERYPVKAGIFAVTFERVR
jgi:hypothetical protein